MIIDLPKQLKSDNTEFFMYNNIMKLKKMESFQRLMVKLAYEINGGNRCYYCNRKFTIEKFRTIDHIYPKMWGGPTITNNLVPCCNKCNYEKNNLSGSQYIKLLNSIQEGTYEKCLKEIQELQSYLIKSKTLGIPDNWLSKRDVSDIIIPKGIGKEDYKRTRQYKKTKMYFKTNGYIQRPITTDRYLTLLDGFYSLMFAIDNNISQVLVVQLENVELVIK